MSSQQVPTTSENPGNGIIDKLARHYTAVSIVLGILTLPAAAIPIAAWELYGWNGTPVGIWGIIFIGIMLSASVIAWFYGNPQRQLTAANSLRMSFLTLLGGFGVATAGLGIVLPLATPHYREVFAGGVKVWRQNGWMMFGVVAAFVGGLVLIFVALQLARTWERTSSGMRRLLYGYNTILTTLLLILIIGLLNLLPYSGVQPFSYANEAMDWTRAGIHTLHPATKNVLAELKQPVKVYILGSTSDRVSYEMETLVEKCRAENPQMSYERLSRDRNPLAVAELMQKFQLPDSEGVLIVYGPEGSSIHDFIKANDLFEQKFGAGASRDFVFKGENALLNSLTFLASNKSKAVVYFTQGNGELDFKSRQVNDIDVGIGALIDDLNRVNYQARELPVAPDTDKVPDDADIIVVARPREEIPAKFVTALRDYLKGTNRKENKKGKLMVLFDVVQRGGKGPMVRTGLEALVAEYGVRVADDRVISPIEEREPLKLTVVTNSAIKNPVAQAFNNEAEGAIPFVFYSARTVTPVAANPAQPAPSPAETLLFANPRLLYLIDTDLNASPTGLVRELNQQARNNAQQARNRLTTQPSVGVVVTEGKMPAPIPGHEFQAKEGQPRMVVMGDATWISNRLEQQFAPYHFNLFVSCLSWLAERADIGERVPPTQHDLYHLKAAPGSGWRLMLLPGALMILGVLVLGLGVWVVRRR